VEVSVRSGGEADAVNKEITIIPEGIERDYVENLILKADKTKASTLACFFDIKPPLNKLYISVQ